PLFEVMGTNANGTFFKSPSGRLTCLHRMDIPTGGGEVWTFPHVYSGAAQPTYVSASINQDAAKFPVTYAIGTSSATVRIYSTAGTGISGYLTLKAEGRWK